MNRRVARIKGMQYVRLLAISRSANSNSGAISERYGFAHHMTHEMAAYRRAHPTSIQYADLAGFVKMLDMRTGGSRQGGVNDAQALVIPKRLSPSHCRGIPYRRVSRSPLARRRRVPRVRADDRLALQGPRGGAVSLQFTDRALTASRQRTAHLRAGRVSRIRWHPWERVGTASLGLRSGEGCTPRLGMLDPRCDR